MGTEHLILDPCVSSREGKSHKDLILVEQENQKNMDDFDDGSWALGCLPSPRNDLRRKREAVLLWQPNLQKEGSMTFRCSLLLMAGGYVMANVIQ